ncbi:MAG: NUDIX domain-containing protein [Dethiobacteria bacterium]
MDLVEKTIKTRHVYEGKILNLRVDDVLLPDGSQSKREIVEHPGAVAIVPINDKKEVVFVKQFRKPAEKVLLEIPAGTLKPGETAESCAQRELAEETGYRAGRLQKIASYYSSPGFVGEKISIFLAQDLIEQQVEKPAGEFVIKELFPLSEASRMINEGIIEDGKTIIGLLLALEYIK